MRSRMIRLSWLVVVNLFIAIGLGEATVRICGYKPLKINDSVPMADSTWGNEDPRVGWTNREGVRKSNEAGNEPMTFWSLGQRSTAVKEDKNNAQERPRIVILGDSWAQGYGVKDEDTFGWKLQELNPDLLIDNFGTGGHGVLQSWLMMQRFYENRKSDDAKLFIFAFTSYMNDRNLPSLTRVASLRTVSKNIYFPPFAEKTSDGGFAPAAPFFSSRWPLEEHLALINFLHDNWLKFFLWWHENEVSKNEVTFYFIKQMRELSKKNGASFLFVWLELGNLHSPFEEYFGKNGIKSINCQHPKGFIPELRVGGEGHPNGEYHEYVANCISNYIRQNPMLVE